MLERTRTRIKNERKRKKRKLTNAQIVVEMMSQHDQKMGVPVICPPCTRMVFFLRWRCTEGCVNFGWFWVVFEEVGLKCLFL